MEQWDKSFYISSVAGSNNGSSLVVMSKGIGIFLVTYIITLPYPPICLGQIGFVAVAAHVHSIPFPFFCLY